MIFEVSKNIPLSHFAQETFSGQKIFLKNPPSKEEIYPNTSLMRDLVLGHDQILQIAYTNLEVDEKKKAAPLPPYAKSEPINECFQKLDGMSVLIEAAKKSINSLKIKEVKEMWSMWINEIESFSQLQGFMGKLSKHTQVRDVLYNLIFRKFEFKPVVLENKVKEQEKFIAD